MNSPQPQPESVSPQKAEDLKPETQAYWALSFDEYYSNPETEDDNRKRLHFRLREIAWGGWNARQPEIEASHERERVLREELRRAVASNEALRGRLLEFDSLRKKLSEAQNSNTTLREERDSANRVCRTFAEESSKWKEKAEESLDKEQARWQEAIYKLVCESSGDSPIDGGGCDSGDPLDFTLCEIGQGFWNLEEKHEEELRAVKAERDELEVRLEAIEDLAQGLLSTKRLTDCLEEAVLGILAEANITEATPDEKESQAGVFMTKADIEVLRHLLTSHGFDIGCMKNLNLKEKLTKE